VNTLGPWSTDYFKQKKIKFLGDLSEYEQKLLDVKNRDDGEIFQLYNMIHDHYQTYGGIQEDHWLNLYQSLKSMQIDDVSINDPHPGIKSQTIFVDYLFPVLQKLDLNAPSDPHNHR
jgi:hypothetical protein